MEKSSGSGITLTLADGSRQTLEEVVDEESLRNIALHSDKENRYKLYRRPHIKASTNGKVDKSTRTKLWTVREVAKINWERRTMEITGENLSASICDLLATGESYTTKNIYEVFREKGTELTLQQVRTRVNYMIYQTQLRHLIYDKEKIGNAHLYKLKGVASDLSSKDLLTFVYSKSSKKAYREVLDRNPDVAKYLNGSEVEPEEDVAPVEEKTSDDINEALAKVIGEQLGMRVEVTGRVEVVFKFG